MLDRLDAVDDAMRRGKVKHSATEYFQRQCFGVQLAKKHGFKVGIVTNSRWATTDVEALEWLRPLAGMVDDLSISDDDFHGSR